VPTNYPTSLDTITEPASTATLGDTAVITHHQHHVNLGDAVEAIEAELGTDPSGPNFTTVGARLRALGLLRGFAYVAGNYYDGTIDGANGSTATFSNMNTWVTPFFCVNTTTFDRIGVVVTTAVAGSIRLGIYEADPDTGYPAAGPLLDAGTVDPGTTGGKEIIISQQLTGGRLYWLGLSSTANNVGLRTKYGNSMGLGLPSLAQDNNWPGRLNLGSTGGTLNTAGGAPSIQNGLQPSIRLRAS